MLNVTSRIAVKVQNLPDWSVDWNDVTPQRPVESLTISDFMPSEDDASHLKQRAIQYIKKFLVNEFSSLADLKVFITEDGVDVPTSEPTQVVPMKVLFKDEKYTSETIDVLSHIAQDANLGEKQQPQFS